MNYVGDTIGWADISGNMIDGACLYNCPKCYEQRRRQRFKLKKEITYKPDWYDNKKIKWFTRKFHRQPRIFVCDNHDLLGVWIPSQWIEEVINVCESNPDCIFQFLTQNPARYSEFDWLDNCWLGTTVRTQKEENRIVELLKAKAKIKFISYEPVLEEIDIIHVADYSGLYWCPACENFSIPTEFENEPDEDDHEQGICPHCGHSTATHFLPYWPYETFLESDKEIAIRSNIDLIIVGCATDARAKDCKLEWIVNIVEQRKTANVATWLKQIPLWGINKQSPLYETEQEAKLHYGEKVRCFVIKDIDLFPKHLRRREWPK